MGFPLAYQWGIPWGGRKACEKAVPKVAYWEENLACWKDIPKAVH
jgi:hypothetical protein